MPRYSHNKKWIAPSVFLWVTCLLSSQGVCQETQDGAEPIVVGDKTNPAAFAPDKIMAGKEEEAILSWLALGEKRFQKLLEAAVTKRSSGAKRFLFGRPIQPYSLQDVIRLVMERNLVLAMQPHQVNVAKQGILATSSALNPELSLSVQHGRNKSRSRSALIGRMHERGKEWDKITLEDLKETYNIPDGTPDGKPVVLNESHVGKTWFEVGLREEGLSTETCVMLDNKPVSDTCESKTLYDTLEEFASGESDNWSKLWSGSMGVYAPLPWGGGVNASAQSTYIPSDTPISISLKPVGAPLETALNVGEQEWFSNLSVGWSSPLPFTKNFGSEGFGTVVQVNKATLDYEKSRSTMVSQVNQTLKETSGAYWSLVRSLLTVISSLEQRTLLEQRLAQTRRLHDAQRVTEYDKMQTEADLEDARNQEEMAWNTWVIRANALADLLNLPPDQIIMPQNYQDELAENVLPDDSSILSAALERRAELQSARIDVQKLELEKAYRAHQLLPDLTLSASYNALGKGSASSYGYNSFEDSVSALATPDERNYRIGLIFSVPLGNQAAKVRHVNANSAFMQAVDRARMVEISISQDVANALANAHGSQLRVGLARSELQLARSALSSAERLRQLDSGTDSGTGSVTNNVTEFELLQKHRSLFAAYTNLIQALIDRRQAWVNLQYSQGKLGVDPVDQLAEQAP